jgi:hypothetical protein
MTVPAVLFTSVTAPADNATTVRSARIKNAWSPSGDQSVRAGIPVGGRACDSPLRREGDLNTGSPVTLRMPPQPRLGLAGEVFC